MARLSLRDLADAAGVSVATVSMALRNHRRISSATRERIKRLAEEMNYSPSPQLAALGSARFRKAKNLFPLPFVEVETNNPYPQGWRDRVAAAVEVGRQFGFDVREVPRSAYRDGTHLGKMLRSRGMEAVLIGEIREEGFVESFPWADFCSLGVFDGLYEIPVDYVARDVGRHLRAIWQRCFERGYRRIGFVWPYESVLPVDHFEVHGTIAELASGRFGDPECEIFRIDFDKPDELLGFLKNFQPDVLVAISGWIVTHLNELGYSIPQDVAFVAVSEVESERKISGYVDPWLPAMVCALSALETRVRRFEKGIPKHRRRILVEAEWNEGETLPWKRSS